MTGSEKYEAAKALKAQGISTKDACKQAKISVSMFHYHNGKTKKKYKVVRKLNRPATVIDVPLQTQSSSKFAIMFFNYSPAELTSFASRGM